MDQPVPRRDHDCSPQLCQTHYTELHYTCCTLSAFCTLAPRAVIACRAMCRLVPCLGLTTDMCRYIYIYTSTHVSGLTYLLTRYAERDWPWSLATAWCQGSRAYKPWFATSVLLGVRCRKAMFGSRVRACVRACVLLLLLTQRGHCPSRFRGLLTQCSKTVTPLHRSLPTCTTAFPPEKTNSRWPCSMQAGPHRVPYLAV